MKARLFFLPILGDVGLHYSLRGHFVVRNSQKKFNPKTGSNFMDRKYYLLFQLSPAALLISVI